MLLLKTKEALKKWDVEAPKIYAAFHDVTTNEEVRLLEAKLEDLWIEVSEAFFEESPNTWPKARLVHPNDPWLRKLITQSTNEVNKE